MTREIQQQSLQLLFGLLEIISLLSVYSVNAFINNNSVPGKLAKIANHLSELEKRR